MKLGSVLPRPEPFCLPIATILTELEAKPRLLPRSPWGEERGEEDALCWPESQDHSQNSAYLGQALQAQKLGTEQDTERGGDRTGHREVAGGSLVPSGADPRYLCLLPFWCLTQCQLPRQYWDSQRSWAQELKPWDLVSSCPTAL